MDHVHSDFDHFKYFGVFHILPPNAALSLLHFSEFIVFVKPCMLELGL